jgi:hypothetical protein
MFKRAELRFLNLTLSICLEVPNKFTTPLHKAKHGTTPLFETLTFTLISTVGDNIKEAIAIFINSE